MHGYQRIAKSFIFWVLAIGFGGALAVCIEPALVWCAGLFHKAPPENFGIISLLFRQVATLGVRSPENVSYADFISILLTAISVILASLGFVIAMAALIGWKTIGDHVSAQAQAHLKESLKPGNELHKMVMNEVNRVMYDGVDEVGQTLDAVPRDEETH